MKYFACLFTVFSVAFATSSSSAAAVNNPNYYLDQGVKSGDVTFYSEWKGNPGSCGFPPNSNQYRVAALSSKYMQLPPGMTNPNNHPICAPQNCILLQGPLGAMVVKVTDTCAGCKDDDVDVADEAYSNLAHPDAGRVVMQWKFVDCSQYPLGPFTGDTSKVFGTASNSTSSASASSSNSTSSASSSGKTRAALRNASRKNVIFPTEDASSTTSSIAKNHPNPSSSAKQEIQVPISNEIKRIVAVPEAKSLYIALIQQINIALEKIVRVIMRHENVNIICEGGGGEPFSEAASSSSKTPTIAQSTKTTKKDSLPPLNAAAARIEEEQSQESSPETTTTTKEKPNTPIQQPIQKSKPSTKPPKEKKPIFTTATPSASSQDETTTLTIEEEAEEEPNKFATSSTTISSKPTSLPNLKPKKTPDSSSSSSKEEEQQLPTKTQSEPPTQVASGPKKSSSKLTDFLNSLDIKADDSTVKKFVSFLSALTSASASEEENAAVNKRTPIKV